MESTSTDVASQGAKLDESSATGFRKNPPPTELGNLTDVTAQSPLPEKLCGYLNKIGPRGIIRTSKRRWFVFSESNCKLFFYRKPDDILPLGEIDVGKATFSFEVTNVERPGLFLISTPDKTHELEAKDRQACLFWLQELQKRRKEFSRKKTAQVLSNNTKLNRAYSVGKPESGLIRRISTSHDAASESNSVDEDSTSAILSPVACPKDVIGEEAAHRDRRSPASRTWSLSKLGHIKDQVVQSVNNRRQQKRSTDYTNDPSAATGRSSVQSNSSRTNSASTDESSSTPRSPTSTTDESSEMNESSATGKRITWRLGNSFRNKDGAGMDCRKCHQFVEQFGKLKQEFSSMEDELTASREVMTVLQMQIDHLSQQRASLIQKTALSSDGQNLLNEKDKQIVDLKQVLLGKDSEIVTLRDQLRTISEEVEHLRDQLTLYEEAVQVKDDLVVRLTNQVSLLEDLPTPQFTSDCIVSNTVAESDRGGTNASSADPSPTTPSATTPQSRPQSYASGVSPSFEEDGDVGELRDSLQAYMLQNRFLNKEILELNQLRKESEDRENKLLILCSDWEAKFYQIQSKYLLLLNDLHRPDDDDQNKRKHVVSQLFEDAMAHHGQLTQPVSVSRCVPDNDYYDEFGFSRTVEMRGGSVSSSSPTGRVGEYGYSAASADLTSRASAYLKRSENIRSYIEDSELEAWFTKWENFVANLGNNKELPRTDEVKLLMRFGIPYEHKGYIWKKCVDFWVKGIRENLKPDYYKQLISSHVGVSLLNPAAKQIELDLLRTLPNNRHYETPHADGIPKLRRVLLAYSFHNQEVGYCQGLNRLAAIGLLFMNEEDAFWCLVAIIECIMPPDYYNKNLMGSLADQRVLKELMAEKLPKLYSHCESCGVDLSLFTFNWFHCVFVDHNVPVEAYLRIWDTFLFEGSKVMFRYALAFFKMHEESTLEHSDAVAVNRHLRLSAEKLTDLKRLTQIAFNELNPFPMRLIRSKRIHHLHIVKCELEELEKQRRSYHSSSESRIEMDSDED